ncbi:MAG: hypothetical protein IKG18_11480 [Atopobiaceae bacterium]|nr:hypothetical protein [Atopobiaceae bacterium]
MGNCKDFQVIIGGYRSTVGAELGKLNKELARLEGYRGEKADGERDAANKRFKSAVSAARDKARSELRPVLQRMKDKADAYEAVEAPTAEQVNILTMLSLRTSISPTEAKSAAEALAGNDAALTTLSQLCATRGGAIVGAVHKSKSKRGRAYDVYKAFEESAGMFLSWEGGTRAELMAQRQVQHVSHVPESERVPLGAAVSADVAAESMPEYDFVKVVLGNSADYNSSSLVD